MNILDLGHKLNMGCQGSGKVQSKSDEADTKEQSANEALRKEIEALKSQLGKIKDALRCIKCSALDRPVVVLGKCGHNICDPCLKNINQVYYEAFFIRGVSTAEAFKVRVCPSLGCNQPIIGLSGLPNRASEASLSNAHKLTSPINFHEAAHLGFLASNCLAISAVESLLKELTAADIDNGIHIFFEAYVSSCIFDQVCNTLTEKLGRDITVRKATVMEYIPRLNLPKGASCVYVVRGMGNSDYSAIRKIVIFERSGKYTIL